MCLPLSPVTRAARETSQSRRCPLPRFLHKTHLPTTYVPDKSVEDLVHMSPVRCRRLQELAAKLVGEVGPLLGRNAPLSARLQVDLVADQNDGDVFRRSHLRKGMPLYFTSPLVSSINVEKSFEASEI